MTRKREYPHGRLGPDDEGAIDGVLELDREHQRINLLFGKMLSWVSMTAADARAFSLHLRQQADTLDPPVPTAAPPANRLPRNVAGLAFLEMEDLHISSYTPLPDGKGVCTEVHMRIQVKGLAEPLLLRFHGPGTLDQLIEALQRHRFDVWPR